MAIKPTNDLDMWANQEGILNGYAVYYNPAAHGLETLELLAQFIEKGGTDLLLTQAVSGMCGCCRLDCRYEVGGFKFRGVNILREDCKSLIIQDVIVPDETIYVDTLKTMVRTPFCLCENGCKIF